MPHRTNYTLLISATWRELSGRHTLADSGGGVSDHGCIVIKHPWMHKWDANLTLPLAFLPRPNLVCDKYEEALRVLLEQRTEVVVAKHDRQLVRPQPGVELREAVIRQLARLQELLRGGRNMARNIAIVKGQRRRELWSACTL
jgi:hypothetical protein